MGVKGVGEAGAIGTCAAVMNAMVDALNLEYVIMQTDIPLTPVIFVEGD